MTRSIQFSVPWPPSVNSYWRHIVMPVGKGAKSGGGKGKQRSATILSQDAREYRLRVIAQLGAQRVPRGSISGKMRVDIEVFPPDRRARDLDNLPKGILDALKHSQVIRDDCDIDELRIRRRHVQAGGIVMVTITEIAGEATQSADLFAPATALQQSAG